MPNNLISRIEGLLEKATKAPWSTDDRSFGDEDEPPYGPYGYISTPGRRGKPILQAIQSRKVNDDLRLTAELRNKAPALMKVVRAAEALMAKVESDDYVNETAEYEALRSALAELEER